ncbi:LptF/LptG family permease [Deinococcus sp.]|uniref:LptF/LptG family permease n=1 Tax=Deinococcus sp. TaxID=47478 RepID=UPI003B59A141
MARLQPPAKRPVQRPPRRLTTRLTRYVTGELLPPLLLGTLMFSAVLSFGYFFISSQFISGAPITLIGRWLIYQLPDTLVKVLPMAVVLMVVVAFGRMASERELVAVQAGGISLSRLARPVTFIALAVTLLSLWLSLWVAPRANLETRSLYWDSLTGAGLSTLSGKTVDLGQGLLLSLGSYDTASQELRQVRLERWQPEQPQRGTLIFAASGTFVDKQLKLRDYQVYTVDFAAARSLSQITDPAALQDAVQNVFLAVQAPDDPQTVLTLNTGLSRSQTLAQYADAIGADAQGWTELRARLSDPERTQTERNAAQLTLNRKLSLPFGNLVLALTALPFALRFGRSLGVALGIALMIAVAYYLLFFVGLTLAAQAAWLIVPGAWFANLAFVAYGLFLRRRAI